MIEAFLNHQRVNNIKESTLVDQKSKLGKADLWKPLSRWRKADVTAYILFMKSEGYNDSTIEMVKALLRKFFVFSNKEKYFEGIKIRPPRRQLKRADILTPEDVDKMITTSKDNKYKALIAFLFESGARINEVLDIRVKDLEDTDHGLKVYIPATKTGEEYRPCLCVYSGQYIRNHILYPKLEKEDCLFEGSVPGISHNLKKIADMAGIDKPVSPQKFRHAQATYMVRKGYQESIIRAKLGWTDDSRMIARYTHIDGGDVINATLEKEGVGGVVKAVLKGICVADPIAIAPPTQELNRLQVAYDELKHEHESLSLRIDDLSKLNEEFLERLPQILSNPTLFAIYQEKLKLKKDRENNKTTGLQQ